MPNSAHIPLLRCTQWEGETDETHISLSLMFSTKLKLCSPVTVCVSTALKVNQTASEAYFKPKRSVTDRGRGGGMLTSLWLFKGERGDSGSGQM